MKNRNFAIIWPISPVAARVLCTWEGAVAASGHLNRGNNFDSHIYSKFSKN